MRQFLDIIFIFKKSNIKNLASLPLELKYIWTGEFRVLKNLNLNFSNTDSHQFFYENSTLKFLRDHKNVLDFGAHVLGVTAIAGPNGVGKSTICELICGIVSSHGENLISFIKGFKGILCVGNYIFYHKSLILNNLEELSNEKFQLIPFSDIPLAGLPSDLISTFRKFGVIYYSNVLDFRGTMDYPNMLNYSQGYLLHSDFTNSTLYKPQPFTKHTVPDLLKTHYLEDSNRIVKFYLSIHDDLPFSLPSMYSIEATSHSNNDAIDYKRYLHKNVEEIEKLEVSILLPLKKFFLRSRLRKEVRIPNELLKEVSRLHYRFNVLIATVIQSKLDVSEEQLSRIVYNLDVRMNADDLIRIIPIEKDIASKIASLFNAHLQLISEAEFAIVDQPHPMSSGWELEVLFKVVQNFTVENTSNNSFVLSNFLMREDDLVNSLPGRKIRFTNFALYPQNSTGEYNFFALFARLDEAINKSQDAQFPFLWKTILFIFDEADSGFHPTWSKQVFNWIVRFLEYYTNKFKGLKFQLLFTTHSPFLLSDLTTENLILLSNKNHQIEVLRQENQLTFAANINELLAETFFMEDGLIGDFAKDQIQRIINDLNRWLNARRNGDKVENPVVDSVSLSTKYLAIISAIADDIVRNKLLEMYLEVFDDDIALQKEIEATELRLNYLKSKRKK